MFYSPTAFSSLSEVSSVDTLSVTSQRDEVCAQVLVRIGDQAEVNTDT